MLEFSLLSLSSGVWWHHQGRTVWSDLVSRLSGSIWTQHALCLDHRGGFREHYKVWAFYHFCQPFISANFYYTNIYTYIYISITSSFHAPHLKPWFCSRIHPPEGLLCNQSSVSCSWLAAELQQEHKPPLTFKAYCLQWWHIF